MYSYDDIKKAIALYILAGAPLELFGYHESRRPTQGSAMAFCISGDFSLQK